MVREQRKAPRALRAGAAGLLIVVIVSLLSACGRKTSPPPPAQAADPYDPAAMDFHPSPAVVSETSPPPPASLPALAVAPRVPPSDPSPVKEVRLDVTNKVIEIAPGVKYSAWTFGDSVPGPVVRVRVGDRVKFTMTNRSAEGVGGVTVGVPMPHSMDFHSAMVSPQDKYRSITPGQTISFEFTANYPGVFMYHCGTPMILEHLASGMYGMMIVEPRGGYPTKVDREYAVVQSEFYAKPDPNGGKAGADPLYVLDLDRVKEKRSTQVVFNGRFNGMVEHPLEAHPGERVRLYVLNAGPNGTSSFHVVGTIFDRAWMEGNPDNQMRGMQTVLLGASSGLIVEFVIPEKGKYVMVDHEFADATQGAIGVIDATSDAAGASGQGGQTDAEKGHALLVERCAACHLPPAGMQRIAPDLAGVTSRHGDEWLAKWISDPTKMLAEDQEAQRLLGQWKTPMPNLGLTPDQVRQVIAYFHQADGATPGGGHVHE